MRYKLGILLVVLSLTAIPALGGEHTGAYRVGVDGLSCPFCAYGIEKHLSRIAGVDRLEIDIKAGLVTVHMKNGVALAEAAAAKAAKDAGFRMRSFAPVASN